MSKPDDIPADVWTAAETAFDLMLCNCIEASGTSEQFRIDSIEPHARAILAERAGTENRVKGMIADRLAEIAKFAPCDARTAAQNELRILQLKISGKL